MEIIVIDGCLPKWQHHRSPLNDDSAETRNDGAGGTARTMLKYGCGGKDTAATLRHYAGGTAKRS